MCVLGGSEEWLLSFIPSSFCKVWLSGLTNIWLASFKIKELPYNYFKWPITKAKDHLKASLCVEHYI